MYLYIVPGVIRDLLERVFIDCRKTKTKVMTLANQKRRRQSSKPIKIRSNYTKPVLVSLLIGLKNGARTLN